MNSDHLSKDQQILAAMRTTLGGIVRDTTPPKGLPHPLSQQTIDDIKHCFVLIASREKELLEEKGETNSARPRYIDEPKTSHVVDFVRPEKK